MNAEVLYQKKNFGEVAIEFLKRKKLITDPIDTPVSSCTDLLAKTGIHLVLTFFSLLLATLAAVPLGMILFWHQRVARYVLYIIGLLQTIPSIALLALLIPITGIGFQGFSMKSMPLSISGGLDAWPHVRAPAPRRPGRLLATSHPTTSATADDANHLRLTQEGEAMPPPDERQVRARRRHGAPSNTI